jgi:hypothetical protein
MTDFIECIFCGRQFQVIDYGQAETYCSYECQLLGGFVVKPSLRWYRDEVYIVRGDEVFTTTGNKMADLAATSTGQIFDMDGLC